MKKKISIFDCKGNKHLIFQSEIISRVAVYGIYKKGNFLLMVKDNQSLNWEFPGGGVEENESVVSSLKREFFEETGLTLLGNPVNSSTLLYSKEELFFDLTSMEAWRTKRKFYLVSDLSGILLQNGNGDDVSKVDFVKPDQIRNQVSSTIQVVLSRMAAL
jgi:8-oxo-dGTP pyrophosphatase MutT (NUDIX family)